MFVVNDSGSMDTESCMVAIKGTILSVLEEAYRCRDMVRLMVFRSERAEEVLPITRSVTGVSAVLESIPVSSRILLIFSLHTGYEILKRYANRGDDLMMVILTDGKSNVEIDFRLRTDDKLRLMSEAIIRARIRSVVIDTEPLESKLRGAPRLVKMLRVDCLTLEKMNVDYLPEAVWHR